jgi:hypothetical protein
MRALTGITGALVGLLSGCAMFPVHPVQSQQVDPVERLMALADEEDCSSSAAETYAKRQCFITIMTDEERDACVRRQDSLAKLRKETCRRNRGDPKPEQKPSGLLEL